MSLPTALKLNIEGREPFANGEHFGDAGVYERLFGSIDFAIDPNAMSNQGIVDLALAPTDSDGRVRYSTDFYMLKPVEMRRGNGRLLYEVINRGTKLMLQLVNDGPQVEHPQTLEHAGNGFLMRRGYTLLWSGWQGDILPGDGRMTMKLPIPTNAGGTITGTVRTELAPGYSGTGVHIDQQMGPKQAIFSMPLSGNPYTAGYEAVSTDNSDATLTYREYESDSRVEAPRTDWSFARLEDGQPVPDPSHCFLDSGFKRGWIYELIYTAKAPRVMGLGFTGVRDLVSFLKHREADDEGTPNPLVEDVSGIEKAYGWGCSQSARFLREFVYRGHNEDLEGRPVFEAVNPFVSGAGRVTLNYRFAQPGRYPRQHYDHLYPSDQFPFSYPVIDDPLSGQTDGILKRPDTDPYVIHTQSSSEYWQRRGSLVHTTPDGRDLADHDKARVYLFAAAEHSADPLEGPETGATRFPTNPLNVSALQRALLDSLDEWATHGTPPPASRVPSVAAATAVMAAEIKAMFPTMEGVSPPFSPNRLFVQDHGKDFESGHFTREPPREDHDREYTVLVPTVDENGNECPGIRGVELEAPVATYVGWNFRPKGEAEHSMAAVHGSYLVFAETDDEARKAGDSRASLATRYASLDDYVEQVSRAAHALVEQRLLLEEDAQRFIARAKLGMSWRAL